MQCNARIEVSAIGAHRADSQTRLGQTTRNVLVKNAGSKRLVGHAFFKRPILNVTQITAGPADVDSAILDGCSARRRLEFRQLSLGRNRLQLAALKGGHHFMFVGINFCIYFTLIQTVPGCLAARDDGLEEIALPNIARHGGRYQDVQNFQLSVVSRHQGDIRLTKQSVPNRPLVAVGYGLAIV